MIFKAKKLLCFSLILAFSQIANANSSRLITSYSDLVNSVSQGDTVRAIMHVDKCSFGKGSSDAIAGINFTNFNKYPILAGNELKNVVATSIMQVVEHPKYGPVYDYVRLRVFENNTAELLSEFIDPVTYKVLDTPKVGTCTISNGHDQNGLMLYDI